MDEKGKRGLQGDYLLLIYAREILTHKPGATFIGEGTCSAVMYDELVKLGATECMYKTGHSLKAKMKQDIAGEMSGGRGPLLRVRMVSVRGGCWRL